jgi:hypothetical protein
MSDEDDIPVLRNVVARQPLITLTPEQLDEVCDNVKTQARELVYQILEDGLREAEESLYQNISDRLNNELPALIDSVLRNRLDRDTD